MYVLQQFFKVLWNTFHLIFHSSRQKFDWNSIENGIPNIDKPDFCFEWHHNDMAQEVETGECRIFNQFRIIGASITCEPIVRMTNSKHHVWFSEIHSTELLSSQHNAFRKDHFESDLATFIYLWGSNVKKSFIWSVFNKTVAFTSACHLVNESITVCFRVSRFFQCMRALSHSW